MLFSDEAQFNLNGIKNTPNITCDSPKILEGQQKAASIFHPQRIVDSVLLKTCLLNNPFGNNTRVGTLIMATI
jgi:hypothetical protein